MLDLYFRRATQTIVLYNFMSSMEQECFRCSLSDKHRKPIVYRGNPEADILLLGEAPGKIEQEERSVFVGPAGKLLDDIFTAIGLDTNADMCLTNCVYCRPVAPSDSGKQNYTPKEDQLYSCWPLVKNFIRIIKPKIMIACGKTALSQLKSDPQIRIGEHEGQWDEYEKTPLFIMTHPASILHLASRPEEQYVIKKRVWEYMQYFRDTWKEKAELAWEQKI